MVKFWKSLVPVDWPLLNGAIPYQMLSSWLARHWLPEKEQGENDPYTTVQKGEEGPLGYQV